MKRSVISNDDLLYDPDMDNEDQKWVDDQRRKASGTSKRPSQTPGKVPSSDAVLNCPACMVTLTRDCQRCVSLTTDFLPKHAWSQTDCDTAMDDLRPSATAPHEPM